MGIANTESPDGTKQHPVRKAHSVGNSVLVAIAPPLVRKLAIDEATFFEEVEVDGGILLKVRRLQ